MKPHKIIRVFMVIFLVLIQILLLFMTLKENVEADDTAAVCLIVLVMLSILFGSRYLDLHHKEYAYEKIAVAIWVPVGAVICYALIIYSGFDSVLSAGIIGTASSFLPELNKQSAYLKKIPPAIYCGVFVGMSSAAIAPSVGFILAAGILAGVIYILSKNIFLGMGGKLGTMAFGGVLLVSLINWLV